MIFVPVNTSTPKSDTFDVSKASRFVQPLNALSPIVSKELPLIVVNFSKFLNNSAPIVLHESIEIFSRFIKLYLKLLSLSEVVLGIFISIKDSSIPKNVKLDTSLFKIVIFSSFGT